MRTFESYSYEWLDRKRARGLSCGDTYETWLRGWILPRFGAQPIGLISVRHVRRFVADIEPDLAPRTTRHIYTLLHGIFASAVADELVAANPCCLARGDLPPDVDANPEWRAWAVYPRHDASRLLYDERIQFYDRMRYRLALAGGGLRVGEISALRWYHWDRSTQPLTTLFVAQSFRSKKRRVGPTKTRVTRKSPVRPDLASWLAHWKLHGFYELMGRMPKDDDLILPRPTNDGTSLCADRRWLADRMKRDCRRLGIEYRGHHALRATFISLAQEDGAIPDILERITHASGKGSAGRVFAGYSRFSWPALCAEIQKLRLDPSNEDLGQLPLL